MKNRGFTLIEILVVLVIIVILVSMATINTNQDPRKDLLNTQAEKLKFSLEAISDEAIFNNKQIGLFFTQTELNPMLIEVNSTPGNPGLKNLQKIRLALKFNSRLPVSKPYFHCC